MLFELLLLNLSTQNIYHGKLKNYSLQNTPDLIQLVQSDENESEQDGEGGGKSEGENEDEESIEKILKEQENQEEEEEFATPYNFAEEQEIPEMFKINGYFRTRFFFFSNLPRIPQNDGYFNPNYVQSRVRLDPSLKISPTLSLYGQVDVLDDVVWGEGINGFTQGEILCDRYNEGRNFATCSGISRIFALKRFWGEIGSILTLPMSLSVGRQPVHYGLGIFFNDGNGFRNLWDDAHFGSTRDRISLGIKPTDKFKIDLGFDFLMSEIGQLKENLVDPFIIPTIKGDRAEFSLYSGAIYSTSKSTELYFILPYINFRILSELELALEGNLLTGKTNLIPVLGNFSRYSVSAWNLAGRIKWETGLIKLILDGGYASGDDNPRDDKVKSIPMHPDYNAGFILFEDVMARYTAKFGKNIDELFGRGGEYFATRGGVKGAWFVMPTVGLFPFEAIGTYLSVMSAFSNENTLVDPVSGQPAFGKTAKKGLLGVEIDWALKVGIENFEFGTQLGYLIVGDALKSALPQSKNTFKFQLRFTYLF
jgi:hypothetical protein